MPSIPHILDTTLRDGSYAIDFQFTAQDTALISSCLEYAGIRWIEIGHGLGLGAARAGKGDQAATDEAYLKAAASALSTAKFGPFFIPGIGTKEDIDLAASCGAHFIRIGTNVNEAEQATSYIEYAKEKGLIVFANLMKSYAVTPDEFAKQAHISEVAGADYVYLVDSAGGMLPDDVSDYLEAAQSKCTIPLGFHGHNNLSMAVANSLQALTSGATMIDASLQGMGRSEGNAITEILASILQQQGHCTALNVHALLDIAEAFIRPMLQHSGYSSIGVASGRAKFHSSFLATTLRIAHEHGIDPRELMLRMAERDQVNAPEDVLKEIADTLSAHPKNDSVQFNCVADSTSAPSDFIEQSHSLALRLKEQAKKRGLHSVLNIVVSEDEPASVSPAIECAYGCAIANIMLENTDALADIIRGLDGVLDYVLLDSGKNNAPDLSLKSTGLLRYSDALMWSRATLAHLTALLEGSLHQKRLYLLGMPHLSEPIAAALGQSGATIVENINTTAPPPDAIIALSPRKPVVDAELVKSLSSPTLLFDGGIGSIHPDALDEAEERGIAVVRIDLRPALAATALELIHMHTLVHEKMGQDEWDGVSVVAGGIIGKPGDIIVDHITRPTRIIGIADGKGGIQSPEADNIKVQSVRRSILEKQLKPKP